MAVVWWGGGKDQQISVSQYNAVTIFILFSVNFKISFVKKDVISGHPLVVKVSHPTLPSMFHSDGNWTTISATAI